MLFVAGLVTLSWRRRASFLPTFLQVEKGFSPTIATTIFTGLFVVRAAARPITGRPSDRFGQLRISVLTTALGATWLVSLLVKNSFLAAVGSTVLFGAGIADFWPATLTKISQVFPDGSISGDFGASRMVYVGFGSLGPAYIGYVAAELNYAAAFIGLIDCLLLSGSVIFWQLRFGSDR